MNRRRRTFIAMGMVIGLVPTFARTRSSSRPARVTLVRNDANLGNQLLHARLRAWFGELGFVEGRNLALTIAEVNYAHDPSGRDGRAEAQAKAVLAARPDVILVPGAARVRLFQQEPPAIPVVFLDAHADDIVPRVVANPARPGGHVTGSAGRGSSDMPGKSWELLAELRPGLRRIGDFHSLESGARAGDQRVQRIGNASVARKLGVEYREIAVSEKQDFASVASAIRTAGVDGLGVAGHWWKWGEALLAFLERSRIPAVFEDPSIVRRGGLLSLRTKDDESYRQGVEVAVRILEGEDPGAIPVRFVERFHLAVNLHTARAMQLPVPSSILSRADEVIR
jgi:putative ABC transport system substrate-binding protein